MTGKFQAAAYFAGLLIGLTIPVVQIYSWLKTGEWSSDGILDGLSYLTFIDEQ